MTTSTLDYHRQARTAARPRWWRPVAVLVLATVLYVATLVPLMVLSIAVPGLESAVDRALTTPDLSDPVSAAMVLLVIGLMLPAALLAVRLAGGRPAGTLSSVAGRLRWRLLGRCLRLALLLIGPTYLLVALVGDGWREVTLTAQSLGFLAVAVLVVPLQAAAEEYVFRGLLMQTIGAWLRHPAFAVVLPLPLFTFGHTYDALGLLDVTAFGLVAGWLAWRTGGLEAAIALHVVSNAVLVALGGVGLADLTSTEGSVTGLVVTLGVLAVYGWRVRTWGEPQACSSVLREPVSVSAPTAAMTPTTTASTP